MAKLTDRKKNNILALWNTGTFTKVSLAKKYKVSEKIIRNIVDGQPPKNKALVDEQLLLNEKKKSELSPIEIRAVDNAVSTLEKNREYISNLTNLNLSKLENHLKNNKKLEKINIGDGVQQLEPVELDTRDYLNAQKTIDQASITLNVNQRHSNTQLSVNTQNNQVQNNNIELNQQTVKETLEIFDNEY